MWVPSKSVSDAVRTLVRFVRGLARETVTAIVAVAIAAGVAAVLTTIQPYFLGSVANAVARGDSDWIGPAGAYVAFGLAASLVGSFVPRLGLLARERIGDDVALAALSSLLRGDVPFWTHSVADLLEAHSRGRVVAHTIVAELCGDIAPFFLSLTLAVALAGAVVDIPSAALLALVAIAFIAVNLSAMGREMRSSKAIAAAHKEISTKLAQAHGFGEVLRAFSAEHHAHEDMKRHLGDTRAVIERHGAMFFHKAIVLAVLKWMGLAAILGAHFAFGGFRSGQPGSVIVITLAYFQILGPIAGVAHAIERLTHCAATLDTIPNILDGGALPAARSLHDEGNPLGGLTFEALTSGYGGTIGSAGFEETWQPGDVILIRGPSGCGKTSLARVLAGLTPAQSGRVRSNDGQLVDRADLRRRVLYAPQVDYVVKGTLRENLVLGDARISEAALAAACELFGISAILEVRGLSVDDPIGDRGGDFSGGERRRMSLARAYLRHPDVLVLDEPTTNLDRTTARRLIALFVEKMRGGILVVISHDDPTVIPANRVVEWAEGGAPRPMSLVSSRP